MILRLTDKLNTDKLNTYFQMRSVEKPYST